MNMVGVVEEFTAPLKPVIVFCVLRVIHYCYIETSNLTALIGTTLRRYIFSFLDTPTAFVQIPCQSNTIMVLNDLICRYLRKQWVYWV